MEFIISNAAPGTFGRVELFPTLLFYAIAEDPFLRTVVFDSLGQEALSASRMRFRNGD